MNRHMYFRQQEKNYLAHHGIKGQKWGIRRYQNEDGSLTPEGRERYGTSGNTYNAGNNEFKITYKDDRTTCYETKLKNGSYLDIQRYEKAIPGSTYKGEALTDSKLIKLQNNILNEFDSNVFSKVNELEEDWRKNNDIQEAIADYERDGGKADFKNSKPGFSYNIYQSTNNVEVNWPLNDYDRLHFLVNKNGKISSSVHVT